MEAKQNNSTEIAELTKKIESKWEQEIDRLNKQIKQLEDQRTLEQNQKKESKTNFEKEIKSLKETIQSKDNKISELQKSLDQLEELKQTEINVLTGKMNKFRDLLSGAVTQTEQRKVVIQKQKEEIEQLKAKIDVLEQQLAQKQRGENLIKENLEKNLATTTTKYENIIKQLVITRYYFSLSAFAFILILKIKFVFLIQKRKVKF